jgi:hypothetical protein
MRQDFQNRAVGAFITVLFYVLIIMGVYIFHEACKVADSGTMHAPSEWRN